LFVISVWLLAETAEHLRMSRIAQITIALVVLFGYSSAGRLQIRYWQNSLTLFTHAIEATGDNGLAEGNLGSALQEIHRDDLARPYLERAVQLTPTLTAPHYNLGTLLLRADDPDGAERQFRLALQYASDNGEAARIHNNLGVLLSQAGKRTEAAAEYDEAIRLNPNEQNSHVGLGLIKLQQGDLNAALDDFRRAETIAPSPMASYWQGIALEKMGKTQPAIEAYENTLKLAPGFEDARVRMESLRKAQK
jgi:protein O-mannosyl-transferase